MNDNKETFKAFLEANKSNFDLFRDLVSEVNGWNGGLESYEVYEFDDEFFNTFFEGKPLEAARATYFGSIDNWNDEYIRFNGYGNLESLSDYAYEKELLENADEIIEVVMEEYDNLDTDGIFAIYGEAV